MSAGVGESAKGMWGILAFRPEACVGTAGAFVEYSRLTFCVFSPVWNGDGS